MGVSSSDSRAAESTLHSQDVRQIAAISPCLSGSEIDCASRAWTQNDGTALAYPA